MKDPMNNIIEKILDEGLGLNDAQTYLKNVYRTSPKFLYIKSYTKAQLTDETLVTISKGEEKGSCDILGYDRNETLFVGWKK